MAKNPSRKWAAYTEWLSERHGLPMDVLRKMLVTHRRTIERWDAGQRPIPHWAPQVLRLRRMESADVMRQILGARYGQS